MLLDDEVKKEKEKEGEEVLCLFCYMMGIHTRTHTHRSIKTCKLRLGGEGCDGGGVCVFVYVCVLVRDKSPQ